jgi:hypothetical protein
MDAQQTKEIWVVMLGAVALLAARIVTDDAVLAGPRVAASRVARGAPVSGGALAMPTGGERGAR